MLLRFPLAVSDLALAQEGECHPWLSVAFMNAQCDMWDGDKALGGERRHGSFWHATQASDTVPVFNIWLVLTILTVTLLLVAFWYDQDEIAGACLIVGPLTMFLNGRIRLQIYRNIAKGEARRSQAKQSD